MVPQRGHNGDRAGQIAQFTGVVSPEFVPITLLAAGLNQIAGNHDKIGYTTFHDRQVFLIAARLVDYILAGSTPIGHGPLNSSTRRLWFGLAIRIGHETNRPIGGGRGAERVGHRGAVLRDDVHIGHVSLEPREPRAVGKGNRGRAIVGELGVFGRMVVERCGRCARHRD